MNEITIKGVGGQTMTFVGESIMDVEALNHDDTVRCEMHLYKTDSGYLCQRTLDVRYSHENCKDILGVYQFFGTEPLANYLYGLVGFSVPGMRQQRNIC